MHCAMGYRVCEDEEQLRGFNTCIRGIIQSERQRWQHRMVTVKVKCAKCKFKFLTRFPATTHKNMEELERHWVCDNCIIGKKNGK